MQKTILSFMKLGLLIIIIACLSEATSLAQVLAYGKEPIQEVGLPKDENVKPLSQVLSMLGEKFNVNFNYNSKLVKGKLVKVHNLKDLKELDDLLKSLLGPLHLDFEKIENREYVIYESRDSLKELKSKSLPSSSDLKNTNENLESLSAKAPSYSMISFSVSGKVTSETGEGLPGVNVVLKGTTTGTITNSEGIYNIALPEESGVLIFSYLGYDTQELAIDGKSIIDVQLAPNVKSLSEVVVIGYGTQKRSDLTGSVASVDTKIISKIATNDITKALQGQVTGVSVHSGGEPGAAPLIKIRGVSSFNNSNPLYIVDGVQTPINDLPMSNIETLQVLKDASAAAIYGSRAANGVVIITTKRGQKGKLKVNYNAYYGSQKITGRYDVLNREQYQTLINEASVNAGVPILPANDPSSSYYVGDVDTDWQKESFKMGMIQDHSLNLSGGNETSTFNVLLNYFDQTGTIKGNGPAYKRYSIGINSDHKFGKFKLGETLSYTMVAQDFMTFLATGNSMLYIVNAIPTLPVYDKNSPDGFSSADKNIHGSYTANAVGFNSMLNSNTNRYRLIGNVYGEYEFFSGLKYRLSLSYERTDWRDFYFQPQHGLGWFYVNNIAKLNDWRGSGYTGTVDNTVTYDKSFGKHSFTALIGNTVLGSSTSRIFGHSEGFTKPYLKTLSHGPSGVTSTGDEFQNRLLSYFGRLIYSYNDKYLLTATIRRDGSSRFGKNNRWGNFPSIALGWKLHNEDFIKNLGIISQMKLRASYGVLGNQEIPNYAYEAYTNAFAHAVFSNQLAQGETQVELANNDIRWESKKTRNIGIDLGFFQNKLSLTAEYYNNISEDMLVGAPIPEVTGVYPWKAPIANVGSVRNSGVEFQIGYKDRKGDFEYSINGNLTTLKNKVLSLGYFENAIYGMISRTTIGSEVGEFYGWDIVGIFQNQEDIDALNANAPPDSDGKKIYQEKDTRPGDYKFRDVNGRNAEGKLTGLPDGKINDDDRVSLGSAIPKLYFGFNVNLSYKNFDFSAIASGLSGNKVFNSILASIENGGNWDNYSTNMLNRWTPTHTDTDVPRLVMYDPNKNGRNSRRWLEDGKYLKISNIQFGYTLPQALINKIKVSNVRVYVAGQNLYTFTKYKGFDPDFGNDGMWDRGVDHGSYPNRPFNSFSGGLPNPRTILVGIQLGI